MTKWEYKLETFEGGYLDAPDMIKINKLGKDGWELVGFTTVGSASAGGESYSEYRLIFKRPIK